MGMDSKYNPSATLHEIRALMERSTRFISLSGLSGVAAGIIALIGVGMVYIYLDLVPFESGRIYFEEASLAFKWNLNYAAFFVLDALFVLLGATVSCIYFTYRKAKKKGQKIGIQDALTRRLLINLLVPLAAGGVFCLALIYHELIGLLAPATLIFYGLALLNASKFTYDDMRSLGYLELTLGLIALFMLPYGLEFWALGFGFLHIFYGILMYQKYD